MQLCLNFSSNSGRFLPVWSG